METKEIYLVISYLNLELDMSKVNTTNDKVNLCDIALPRVSQLLMSPPTSPSFYSQTIQDFFFLAGRLYTVAETGASSPSGVPSSLRPPMAKIRVAMSIPSSLPFKLLL